MRKKYIEMRAVGLTVDAELKFPLLMLKNDLTGRVFPISLDTAEKNFLLNTLINRCNLHAGLLKRLIEQCHLRVARIVMEENASGELTAQAILRAHRRAETVLLSPKEGILLAMEFNVPVQVAAGLLEQPKYYRRPLPPETNERPSDAVITDPWFSEEELLPTEKEETLQ